MIAVMACSLESPQMKSVYAQTGAPGLGHRGWGRSYLVEPAQATRVKREWLAIFACATPSPLG